MEPPASEALTTLHVRRAVDGTSESLEWVVERLSPLLLALASYRLPPSLRRACDPQDLVNETWMVALPRLADLQPREGRLTPVLLKFLTSTLLLRLNNLIRKQVRRARRKPGDTSSTDKVDTTPSELADHTRGVVTRVVHREIEGRVLHTLDQLPETDREVILLRGIEQQDNRTVATLLGLEPAAVSMRYHRALERLRGQLPGSVFEEL